MKARNPREVSNLEYQPTVDKNLTKTDGTGEMNLQPLKLQVQRLRLQVHYQSSVFVPGGMNHHVRQGVGINDHCETPMHLSQSLHCSAFFVHMSQRPLCPKPLSSEFITAKQFPAAGNRRTPPSRDRCLAPSWWAASPTASPAPPRTSPGTCAGSQRAVGPTRRGRRTGTEEPRALVAISDETVPWWPKVPTPSGSCPSGADWVSLSRF